MVHVGKHGNLEWLPGKTAGHVGRLRPDAAIGDLPLIYPFLVNDPGEGTQAKRRVHATLVDHLVPPMARAESYGDIARLEQLLDEHAQIAAMDPAKLPAIRAQIWTLIQAAKLDHDLGLDDRPHDAEFDEFLLHVDGWLCEIKDAQIRDGLHVLGRAPTGAARVNLVLAMLRARQMWGGRAQALPGLREALGYAEQSDDRAAADAVEAQARALVEAMEAAAGTRASGRRRRLGTRPARPPTRGTDGADAGAVADVLDVRRHRGRAPAGRRRPTRSTRILHALDGGFIPAGPSGSPLRGLVNVLPTGRNFYSVDPRAVPSRLAWETGQAMADSLLERYLADTGEYPQSVGPVGVGHLRDAHLRRRHRRGAGAARRPAGVGRGVAPGQRARAGAAGRAGPPADRRDRADQRLLPRRVPARGHHARRRRAAGRRAGRAATSRTTSAPTPAPTSPRTATSAAPPPGSSAPSRARTGPGCCR